jgi:hypothetical protein
MWLWFPVGEDIWFPIDIRAAAGVGQPGKDETSPGRRPAMR